MTPVLEARSLKKSFPARRDMFGRTRAWTHAVKDVSLTVGRGETLGLLGESGAGKSTVGRMLLRLLEPDSGTVHFEGADVGALGRQDLRAWRSRARMIFQDPFVSLDPSMVVGDSVGEALTIHEGLRSQEREARVLDLFERVGLGAEHMGRYPAEFSGGQLQRVAVARAISTNPDVIVCDEPVAALDMSIRAQVINLLRDLQEERGIALVFISHDLSLVRLIADRVAVMYRGRVVESGDAEEIFASPSHPYTQALLSAIPTPDPDRRHTLVPPAAVLRVVDEQQDLVGCDYADRCPSAVEICSRQQPELRERGATQAACHLVGNGVQAPGDAEGIRLMASGGQ